MAENIKIMHIEALAAAISNMQIACEPTVDADLGNKMWCGKDADGTITKFLSKGNAASVTTIQLTGTTTVGGDTVLVADTNGDVTGNSDLFGFLEVDDGEIVYGNATSDGVTSDSDFTWDDGTHSLRAGPSCVASGDHSLAMGDTATASGNYSEALGIVVTASGGASRAKGASCTASHDYCEVRGNGGLSVWPGASHVCGDQVDGNESSQIMTEMVLVARTTDATQTTMLFDLNDSASPLYCPDEGAQYLKVEILAASAAGTYDGISALEVDLIVMRDDPNMNVVSPSGVSLIGQRGDAAFKAAIDAGCIGVNADTTNKVVRLLVTGEATTTINWVAKVSGIQTKTDHYDAGS